MTAPALFKRCIATMPLVAILRGVRPEEILAIGDALIEAGIRVVEIPLNSPDPLRSIEQLATHAGDEVIVGAGTVLETDQVAQVQSAGGRIIVSPSTDTAVISAAAAAGLVSAPGYFTPSEGFLALRAGAHALKLFPAEAASPAVLKAQRAVLPKEVPLLVVGGVSPETLGPWMAAGADGFGLGSGLFKPGRSAAEVAVQARAYVAAAEAARRG